MTQLYSIEIKEQEGIIYIWKGLPAIKKQRPMFPWYSHCSSLGELKSKDKGLYNLRMNVIKKWFSSKDSSYANIYRHYHEIETFW